jgi:hypothetical protein
VKKEDFLVKISGDDIEEMTDEKFLSSMRYGIIALQENKVMHFCGYINPPSENDFASLDEELQTDEHFNLIGEYYDLMLCPDDLFEQIMRDMEFRRN